MFAGTRTQLALDVGLVIVVGTFLVGEAILETGGAPGAVACAATMSLVLLARRRLPLTVYVISSLALESLVIWWYEAGVYPAANAIAIFAVGAYATWLRAVLGLIIGIAGVSAYWLIAPSEPVPALPAIVLGAWVLTWVAGQAEANRQRDALAVRTRLAETERRRQAEVSGAVADERNRVAREVHDIVGHALNVMVLHAGAGRRLLIKDPASTASALETVEQVGREALGELDNVLGILGADSTRRPTPGLSDLSGLADRFTAAGIAVALTVEGEPPGLSKSLELTAYRVVQEALTNVAKHAGGRGATVAVTCSDGLIQIQICDDGPATSPSTDRGRGLLGIRERVAAAGGTVAAGPGPAGGWVVDCTLPVSSSRAEHR